MSDDFRGAGNVRWDWDYRGVLKPMKVSDVEEKRTDLRIQKPKLGSCGSVFTRDSIRVARIKGHGSSVRYTRDLYQND